MNLTRTSGAALMECTPGSHSAVVPSGSHRTLVVRPPCDRVDLSTMRAQIPRLSWVSFNLQRTSRRLEARKIPCWHNRKRTNRPNTDAAISRTTCDEPDDGRHDGWVCGVRDETVRVTRGRGFGTHSLIRSLDTGASDSLRTARRCSGPL